MEGRRNLEFFAPFRVSGSRQSRGRIRRIAHILKCQFQTRVSTAMTRNNFSAEVRTPPRPALFEHARLIPEARKRAGMDGIARPVWGRSADAIWRREREFRGTFE